MPSSKLLGAAFLALVASTLSNAAPTCNKRQKGQSLVAFNYGNDKVRGVNLGGWLVLEPWITPSLFERTNNDEIVDEWTYGEKKTKATVEALERHWDTWITEDDFEQIAAAGLNHVRIPIGYWAWDNPEGEPYISGQAPYLAKAIGWAKKHNLKVVIDLHGAPGSQNGFDNSGRRGPRDFLGNDGYADRTVNVLKTIAETYGKDDAVSSIQLLNEPFPMGDQGQMAFVKDFYRKATAAVRSAAPNMLIMFSDAFDMGAWQNDMTDANMALDAHHYQVFDNAQVSQSWDQHIGQICGYAGALNSVKQWVIVGEWSLGSTDCAKWLNGRGRGSRYQGEINDAPHIGNCAERTGSGDNFSNEYKDFMRKYYDAQVQTYEQNGEGWFYWCWKNEEAADWSYKRGMELGYIPKTDPGNHKYSLNSLC